MKKWIATVGVLLILGGIASLVFGGFSYTRSEKLVDAGPVHLQADTEHDVNVPPYVSGIAIVAGLVLVVAGFRRH